MKSTFCLLLGLLLLPAGSGVLAEPEHLVIRGSTTIYPLSGRIAEQFMRDHRHARVTVDSGGSGEGIRALLAGEADIANSSRFVSGEELSTAMGAGIYPVPFRIADDCIIPIVHKRNKLKDLSRPLFMFTRGWPSGTLLEFINYALDPDRGQLTVLKSGFIPVHLRKNGNAR